MAGLILKDDIEKVRDAIPLDEIVSEYVTLSPAGLGSLKGLCPFHDEKTPSFNVRPGKGLWYCFGCGEGGDVYDFLQKINHVTFTEAVEYLAQKANITVHYEEGSRGPREFGRRQRLIDAHQIAEEFYSENLNSPEAQIAREFLAKRGFGREVCEYFGLGYAPKGWNNLTDLLRSRGFQEQEILHAGLASQGKRGIYDRFRGRLIWPIRDLTNATIGFGARHLYEDDKGPKYLNTPETSIYHKAKVLYGLDLAKHEISKKRQVVIVEGYTDVMAAHLAGVKTAVATCGTAFGAEHVKIIRRLLGDVADPAAGVQLTSGLSRGGEVIFTFDGDAAGRKAALRAFGEDQSFATQTFVAVEKSGMDPCDLRMKRGNEAVRQLIESREPLFEFVLRTTLNSVNLNTAEGRVAGLRACAPIIAGIRDRALQREYSRQLAGWLGMRVQEVEAEVRQARRYGPPTQPGRRQNQPAYGAPGAGRQNTGQGPGPGQGRPQGMQIGNERDPIVRLERQALEAVIQYPGLVMGSGFDELDGDTFVTPAFRAVHDAIRAVGGLAGYVDFLQIAEAEVGVGDEATKRATSYWTKAVREMAAEPVAQVITQLAVTPLPQDDPDGMREYCMGVVRALVRNGLTRQIGELKAQIGRMSYDDERYSQTLTKMMELENKNRKLRQEF